MSGARWPRPTREDPRGSSESGQLAMLADWRHEAVNTARESGLQRQRTRDPETFRAAVQVIEELAAERSPFTADTARARLAGGGGDVLGAAFRSVANRHLIKVVGYTKSKALSRHGSVIATWIGVEP